jgi:transcriptional regulator with GAF, ATPase, and Fis domain
MKPVAYNFTKSQWDFLAVLHAFSEKTPLWIAGALIPLKPVPLFSLIRQGKALGWIDQPENDQVAISPDLPPEIIHKLEKINTPAHLTKMIDTLESMGLIESLEPKSYVALLRHAGLDGKAARMELDKVIADFNPLKLPELHDSLKKILKRLKTDLNDIESKQRFIASAIKISDLCIENGSGLKIARQYLVQAFEIAERLSDRRSGAIIKLHLARILSLSKKHLEAKEAFEFGIAEIEKLGDRDIFLQAAEFIGYYYFLQGRYRQALQYFESAVKFAENNKTLIVSPFCILMLSFCESNLGNVFRAIGTLDYYWRIAKQKNLISHTTLFRAGIGICLAAINRMREAKSHLENAHKQAVKSGNSLTLVFCILGKAIMYSSRREWKAYQDLIEESIQLLDSEGIMSYYLPPWNLEYTIRSEQSNLGPNITPDFDTRVEEIMKGPNINLKGIAMRLRAVRMIEKGNTGNEILHDLLESEKYLMESEDVINLSKTWVQLIRFQLKKGEYEQSRERAKKMFKALSLANEGLFPNDLRFLLEDTGGAKKNQPHEENEMAAFVGMVEQISPKLSMEETLNSLLSGLSRFFKAEHAAVLSFDDASSSPKIRAARNLSQDMIESPRFRPSLKSIIECNRKKAPLITKISQEKKPPGDQKNLSVLCFYLNISGSISAVLYFDNSFLSDCFDFVTPSFLQRTGLYLETYIRKIFEYEQLIAETNREAIVQSTRLNIAEQIDFIAKSNEMMHVIEQAGKMAQSEANILISGETGVGKEIMARWIHQNSPYREGPFIVVDPTTIPETLVDSELFGHERGAFTGADQRKMGRIELADKGTLFIDEIGELPKSVQIKLLRLLHEKTFVRVGGIKTIKTDFRLLAATNRNLEKEVESGRFRQDLYYRLNVLQVVVPPLRQRGKDIIEIAKYYLEYYKRKYNRPALDILPEQEKILRAYEWPGNVRELRNIVERLVLISDSTPMDLSLFLKSNSDAAAPFEDEPTLDDMQRRYIGYMLQRTENRIGGKDGAAERLGMKRTTLTARMKKLGIR